MHGGLCRSARVRRPHTHVAVVGSANQGKIYALKVIDVISVTRRSFGQVLRPQ